MKNTVFILCLLIPFVSFAQGYNSKGGSHRGYNTPYTQQEERPSSWSGSGIAIGEKYIATNNHVVDGATNLYVFFPESEKQYTAEVIKTNPETDLAIIKISESTFEGFKGMKYGFKQAVEDVGEDVFVLGYPLITTMGTEVKLTTGVVSSRSGYQGDKSQYQISAPVQPGNSGGPLFNGKGELIGIVSAKHTEAENVSYGVKLSLLGELAGSMPGIDLTLPSQISSKSLSEKVKAVQPYTVMILADNNRSQGQRPAAQPEVGYSNAPQIVRIDNPTITANNSKYFRIDAIEINPQHTILYMSWAGDDTGWYNVNKDEFILDPATRQKYKIVDTDNCAFAPTKTIVKPGKSKDFVLYFQPIPTSTQSIDICTPDGTVFRGVKVR